MSKLLISLLLLLCTSQITFSQVTDFDRGLKVGEILMNGLVVLKGGKANVSNISSSSTKAQLCLKNKLPEKIQFILEIVPKEDKESLPKKELVIPTNGKECLYELDRQIWNYEIILTAKKETYKKGELKLDGDITITVDE